MSRPSRTRSTGRQLAELSVAAPQVIAHRVTRMALSSPTQLSKRDHKEFTGMVAEKQVAFAQSWWTLCMEMGKMQQSLFWSWMRGPTALSGQLSRMPQTLERISAKSVAPIHRKAVQNSKRLARTKLL
ncbi:hypothetical protein G7047_09155 [Diaphorobacter sp. HDW4A]|uniref:polyhydroxyalkanoate granule-associated phasin n=1 Tax=Diaphorobacter sp. HDW4A TaxID=2714924 RepID=UPI00140A976E|nr:polyhydroxyalkanoate granule-associated phasin [Diaphorobacter sp. HDW4A]QIL80049.1 hypothetical protein G7047_09155 [Diaphorobacter sp. HDW4A]